MVEAMLLGGLRRCKVLGLRLQDVRPGEAGTALEAIQAQAGHRSIEWTRIYQHLANDWLAGEYRRAAEVERRTSPSSMLI
jgi:hypothetical protein